MTVTSLKLPAELKARIAPLAEAAGKTPHAWMVEAIEHQAALAELRESFLAEAQDAARAIDEGGPLYAAEDVRAYVQGLARATPTRRPRALRARKSSKAA